MAVAETIVAKVDPYLLVIVPEIHGPTSYNVRTGFNISVGQLSRVNYARAEMEKASGFSPGASAGRFFVTSGSGNIVTLEVWPGGLNPTHFDGMGLSHWVFRAEAYGH